MAIVSGTITRIELFSNVLSTRDLTKNISVATAISAIMIEAVMLFNIIIVIDFVSSSIRRFFNIVISHTKFTHPETAVASAMPASFRGVQKTRVIFSRKFSPTIYILILTGVLVSFWAQN